MAKKMTKEQYEEKIHSINEEMAVLSARMKALQKQRDNLADYEKDPANYIGRTVFYIDDEYKVGSITITRQMVAAAKKAKRPLIEVERNDNGEFCVSELKHKWDKKNYRWRAVFASAREALTNELDCQKGEELEDAHDEYLRAKSNLDECTEVYTELRDRVLSLERQLLSVED